MLAHVRSTLRRLQQAALTLLDDRRMAAQDPSRVPRLQRFLFFWILVARSFVRNRCMVRATALAYTTLLSLIPLLAVGLGVATSFLKNSGEAVAEAGAEQLIGHVITNVAPQLGLFPTSPPTEFGPFLPGTEPSASVEQQALVDARQQVIETVDRFIENLDSAGLGMTGTVALILVAIGLLSTIEQAFNDIWGVRRGRSWFARVVQYWAAITLGPLILVFAMTFAVGGQLQSVETRVLAWVGPDMAVGGQLLFSLVRNLLPLLFLTAAFWLLYQLMPATQVDWRAAAIGGLVGALLWWINGRFSVVFAAKVVSASKIYGSLGVLPVFLLGLYLSWVILLFGAQVSYAFQNRRIYLQEKQAESLGPAGKELVALRLMTAIGRRFLEGRDPGSVPVLAVELGVSAQLLAQLMEALKAARLLAEVSGTPAAYQPARPPELITCDDILRVLRVGDGGGMTPGSGGASQPVRDVYAEICEASSEAARRRTLLDLVTASAKS